MYHDSRFKSYFEEKKINETLHLGTTTFDILYPYILLSSRQNNSLQYNRPKFSNQ